MTVKDILIKWLEENGYGGLYCRDCGCGIDDLIPCSERCDGCKPGYKVPCDCEEHHEYHIISIKPKESTNV